MIIGAPCSRKIFFLNWYADMKSFAIPIIVYLSFFKHFSKILFFFSKYISQFCKKNTTIFCCCCCFKKVIASEIKILQKKNKNYLLFVHSSIEIFVEQYYKKITNYISITNRADILSPAWITGLKIMKLKREILSVPKYLERKDFQE